MALIRSSIAIGRGARRLSGVVLPGIASSNDVNGRSSIRHFAVVLAPGCSPSGGDSTRQRRALTGAPGGGPPPPAATSSAAASTLDEQVAAALRAPPTSLVIFDKDGTLICFHSMWVPWTLTTAQKIEVASGLKSVDIAQEVYRLLGFCPVSQRVGPGLLAESTMPQVKDELKQLLVKHGLTTGKADEVVDAAWTDCDTTSNETLKSLHDLKHLFETLKENQIKVAVCTADSRFGTEGALKALGLDHLVDIVVCGDDVGTQPKPSPHNALEICRTLGVDPKDTFMVGDTLADLKMGRAANLKGSIGVLSGVGDADHLAPHADHLVPHVGDLLPIVLGRKRRHLHAHKKSTDHHHVSSKAKELPRHMKKSFERGWHIKGSPNWRKDGGERRMHTSAASRMPVGMPPEGVKPSHIVVGAGSAGCVLAARLSEDADNTVLLMEAGPRDDWWRWKIHMPAALMYNLCNDNYNWYYHTDPQPHMDGRTMYWPRGRVWGGSSALNAMVYIRGHAADYDRWHAEGAKDWAYKNCLPYFKKAETYDQAKFGDTFRGWDGPLHVTRGACANPLHGAWLEAGVEAGYGYSEDMNGYRQEGVGHMDMTIYRGKRWSTSQAYLNPALSRKNLYVASGALVSKVLIERGRAIGVEYLPFSLLDSKAASHTLKTSITSGDRKKVYTTKDVILSGGAINSPQVLMLSGIGDGDLLKKLEIPVECHLPAVGENLQDHLEIYVQQACVQPVTLYDRSSWRFPVTMIRTGLEWFTNRTGDAATTHMESGGFVRSTADVPHPDIQFHFLPSTVHDHGRVMGEEHAYQVHVGPMRATSRGTVRIKNNDPRFHPRMDPKYLSTEQDVKDFRECIKISREIFAQKAFDPFRGVELAPGQNCQSDAEIDAFVRAKSDTAYHPSCTCKMGDPSKSDTVVDAETMNIVGIENLKVVDASVMPSIVTGNLNAPTIMLAERAADLIRGRTTLPAEQPDVWQPPHRNTNKAGN